MWLLINIILALVVSYIIYNTALSFLGLYIPFKQSILPVFLFAISAFISKVILKASPIVHTIIMVNVCTIISYVFNHTLFILNLSASLLTFIILIFGSLLFICPLLNKFGISFTIIDFNSLDWIIFNIGELFIPTVCLVFNRVKKFSFINKIIIK